MPIQVIYLTLDFIILEGSFQLRMCCESYLHFSVPDFNVLPKSFLRYLLFYEKYLLNYYFLPENFTSHAVNFTAKPVFTQSFHLPYSQASSIKSHHALSLHKSQYSTPPLLPCMYSLAACLPAFPAAYHILPSCLVPPGVAGNKFSAVDLPPLSAAWCVLWFCSSLVAFPKEVLVCLSYLNNTPGLQCAEMSTVQHLQGILRRNCFEKPLMDNLLDAIMHCASKEREKSPFEI